MSERVVRRSRGQRHRLRNVLAVVAATFLALLLSGAAYQAIATAADRRSYPPPGELVDVGGYRLHLYCVGNAAPTVVLDALFPGTVSNWAWIQPEIAKTARVCAYDRAGLGWSDRGPNPRDGHRYAGELHNLLAKARIPGPYVLVGHSLGGLSVRMFADQYPDQVAGMVLIEATNADAWKRLGKPEGVGVDHAMLVVAPLLGRLGLLRLGVVPSFSSDPDLPERQRAELQAFFDSVKALQTIRDVDSAFSEALDQLRRARGLGDKPLIVVLGSRGDGSTPELRDLFADQARLSTNSRTELVDGATHAGLVDNRDYAPHTTAAILEVVQAVRTGRPLRPN
jgi:pimeloyl-ACP methyl ester carboxylesterase